MFKGPTPLTDDGRVAPVGPSGIAHTISREVPMSEPTIAIPAAIAAAGRRTPTGEAPTEFCIDIGGEQTMFVITAAYQHPTGNVAAAEILSDADVSAALNDDDWDDADVDNYRGIVHLAADRDDSTIVVLGVIHSTHGPADVGNDGYVLAGIEIDGDDWVQIADYTPFNDWASAPLDERDVMPDDVHAILTGWLDAAGTPLTDTELDRARAIFGDGGGMEASGPDRCANADYWGEIDQPLWNRICQDSWQHYTFDTQANPLTLCARCVRELAHVGFAQPRF